MHKRTHLALCGVTHPCCVRTAGLNWDFHGHGPGADDTCGRSPQQVAEAGGEAAGGSKKRRRRGKRSGAVGAEGKRNFMTDAGISAFNSVAHDVITRGAT